MPTSLSLLLMACASGRDLPPDYRGLIQSRTPPETVATCLGRALSTTPQTNGDATVVDAQTLRPARRYTITERQAADKTIETVVTIQGPSATINADVDNAAILCASR